MHNKFAVVDGVDIGPACTYLRHRCQYQERYDDLGRPAEENLHVGLGDCLFFEKNTIEYASDLKRFERTTHGILAMVKMPSSNATIGCHICTHIVDVAQSSVEGMKIKMLLNL